MNTYKFEKFAPSLSDKTKAETIYQEIIDLYYKDNCIQIDFNGLLSMTTFCAKSIFGRLYHTIGSVNYENNVNFINDSEPVDLIIQLGIKKYMEEN